MRPKEFYLVAAVCAILAASASGQVIFSLDDNPAVPATSPPGLIPGFGAEDPYGLGTYGFPGPMATMPPSPSLPAIPSPAGVGAMDEDLLQPSPFVPGVPMMHLPLFGPGYLDAVADNADASPNKVQSIHLSFSVDRITMGSPLLMNDVLIEASLNQQPGDIYRTDVTFPHPIAFAGMLPPMPGYVGPLPSAGMGNTNMLLFDESQLSLTAGLPPGFQIPPGVAAPPIGFGTHDNVDAASWQPFDMNGDFMTDRWLYWTLNPDASAMGGWVPSCADILDIAPGGMATPMPYAFAPQLGLDMFGEGSDCIDALVVWDGGAPGGQAWGGPGAEPVMDYALFSLAHGSISLAQWGLSEADIFFTDFTGAFALYASANDLALWGQPGFEPGDNVDALEILVPGDANLDYRVSIGDLAIMAGNWNMPGVVASWTMGDFNGDGTVFIGDLAIMAGNWTMSSAPMEDVPEPMSLSLLGLGALALIRRRR